MCMLLKGEMRCVNFGIENERGIYNIWVLALSGHFRAFSLKNYPYRFFLYALGLGQGSWHYFRKVLFINLVSYPTQYQLGFSSWLNSMSVVASIPSSYPGLDFSREAELGQKVVRYNSYHPLHSI